MTYQLPELSYDYSALEPHISARIMELHHSKHHNTYVTNLNASLEKLDAAVSAGDVSSIIGLQGALKFNGGGHLNHTLFWENLCAKGSSEFPTSGPLADAVKERFGGLDEMKAELGAMTVGVQGSGWGWLGFDAKTGELMRLFFFHLFGSMMARYPSSTMPSYLLVWRLFLSDTNFPCI